MRYIPAYASLPPALLTLGGAVKVLELFAGSRSVGKACEGLGHEVYSSDIEAFDGIDHVTDILSFDVNRLPFRPDVVWASPPCEKWSLGCGVKGGNIYWETVWEGRKVAGIKPRENFDCGRQYAIMKDPSRVKEQRELHCRIIDKTLEIIKELNPSAYFIENPFGMLRHYLKGKVPHENICTYCQYGFPYRKPTNIFSNLQLTLKTCSLGDECHDNSFYERGKENALREKSVVRGYYDRSKIPHALCLELMRIASSTIVLNAPHPHPRLF